MHDTLLRAVLWAGLGMIAVAILMLAAVLLLRLRLIARSRRERRFSAEWQPLLARCVFEVPEVLPPVAKADRYIFLRLWHGLFESLRGTAQHNLRELAIAVGADGFARGMLAANGVRERLIAITTLGHLADRNAAAALRPLTSDASPQISLAAVRALLEIDADATLPWMTGLAGEREDWPLNKVAAMLSDAGADRITQPLIAAAELAAAGADAARRVPRLLRLLALAHRELATPALLRILGAATDAGVIAACLQVLSDPAEIATVRGYLAHPDWNVRCAAARGLGRLGAPDDRRRLVDLLSDPHWWVRRHAALALVAMPSVTVAELRKIRAILPDRFAADMLGQVIAESL